MHRILLFFALVVAGIACFILLYPYARNLSVLVLGVGLFVIALPMIVIALPRKPGGQGGYGDDTGPNADNMQEDDGDEFRE